MRTTIGGRLLSAFMGVAALVGCGQAAPPPKLQWTDVGRTGEGGQIQYMPSSIQKRADGTTEIVAKVAYPDGNTWTIETPQTVEQRNFAAERITLRYDCEAKTFAFLRREALDKDGYVKETVTPKLPGKADFAPIQPGGIAAVLVARACET